METGAFIDWLSFTVPLSLVSKYNWIANVEITIGKTVPILFEKLPGDWEQARGRAPYKASVHQSGVTVFFNESIDHALIEISGAGCSMLGDDALMDIMRSVAGKVTRIDIARDHVGDIDPLKVAADTPVGRFKARSNVLSNTGETVYLGSRKSEQYIRIYRYNEPHPRSGITRVEYVARKKRAKAIVEQVLATGIDSIYGWVVDTFCLPGSVGTTAQSAEVRLERAGRASSKTLLWLVASVAPAMRRLVENGEIDLDEFVEKHLRAYGCKER